MPVWRTCEFSLLFVLGRSLNRADDALFLWYTQHRHSALHALLKEADAAVKVAAVQKAAHVKNKEKQTTALAATNEKRRVKAEEKMGVLDSMVDKTEESVDTAEKILQKLRLWPMKLYDLGECI